MKLLVRLCMVVLLLGAAVVVVDDGSTSAQFTDRVASTGGVLTAAELPAPLTVTATANGAAIDVAWTVASTDFADGWEIYRFAGTCDAWDPNANLAGATLISSPGTVVTTPDTAGAPGATYCYAVRGTYLDVWFSSFTDIAAEVAYPSPMTTLRPNLSGASHQLVTTSPTSGQEAFGCRTVVLLVCTVAWPSSYVFQSVEPYSVYSDAPWTGSITLTRSGLMLDLLGADIVLTLWYDGDASCGTSPPASGDTSRIATATFSILDFLEGALGGGATETFPASFTPDPSFSVPLAASTICMHATVTPLIQLLSPNSFTVNNATSSITGPFAP